MNLPPQNINAMLLDQPSGSPDAYQAQQALQQAASQEVTNESMTQAQNIARVMEMYREGASGQSTPENKARAGLDYATATIQAMSNSGQMSPGKRALAEMIAMDGGGNIEDVIANISRRVQG